MISTLKSFKIFMLNINFVRLEGPYVTNAHGTTDYTSMRWCDRDQGVNEHLKNTLR